MINILKEKRVLVGVSVFVLLILVLLGYFYFNSKEDSIELEEGISKLEYTTKVTSNNFYVDVKGAVKDPGVYLVSDKDRVIDAITLAGGLKKNASTENINLSQRLESEMVIYVYTTNEIKSGSKKLECDTKCNCEVIEVNNCIENDSADDKININKASIEDLMKLTGVGESKAKAIVSYREENGEFSSIEDIKNVSGIGESLFEKIKDSITI